MSDEKTNNVVMNALNGWVAKSAAGALFTVLGILYWNERDARIELEGELKEVTQEVSELERNILTNYVPNSEYSETKTILLDINSSISEVVERLIKLETKFEISQ